MFHHTLLLPPSKLLGLGSTASNAASVQWQLYTSRTNKTGLAALAKQAQTYMHNFHNKHLDKASRANSLAFIHGLLPTSAPASRLYSGIFIFIWLDYV